MSEHMTAVNGGHTPDFVKQMANMHHDLLVIMQAAWIEWKHGKGPEAALEWIANTLEGPGLIPDETAPYGKEAQAFYDLNRAEPFPACFCGRPSNQLWMGKGFCSLRHYKEGRAATTGGSHEYMSRHVGSALYTTPVG
ncbi:MAG: hypothetical protein RLZZ182_199, partial [Pseudomonadota bacterium]